VPFYLDKLVPCVRGNLIYINDDCIVQGNIKELAATKIASHHVAAFSSECNELLEDIHPNPGRYNSYLDYGNKIVQKMDIPPETCLFNAGVFVVDMKKFKQWNISAKLEYWATMNVKYVGFDSKSQTFDHYSVR
jgi:lipopolysaccharide biosynthesis glycosyltransferase